MNWNPVDRWWNIYRGETDSLFSLSDDWVKRNLTMALRQSPINKQLEVKKSLVSLKTQVTWAKMRSDCWKNNIDQTATKANMCRLFCGTKYKRARIFCFLKRLGFARVPLKAFCHTPVNRRKRTLLFSRSHPPGALEMHRNRTVSSTSCGESCTRAKVQ